MDTPPIQYVRTNDGVSIAYYRMGSGPAEPVVWIELPSQLQLEWKLFPDQARAYRRMARAGAVVRYDHRGFGLSDRSITHFPLDDLVKDLEAVVNRLVLEGFVLIGSGVFPSAVAAAYAATHPDRVSKLVLESTNISPAIHQQISALMLPDSDWQFVSETVCRLALGWDDEEATRALAAWCRESCSYETFKALWRDIEQWDLHDLLPTIQAQTLICFSSSIKLVTQDQVREMASLIPGSHLVVTEGSTYAERMATLAAAIATFIYGSTVNQPWTNTPPLRSGTAPREVGTAIILFADIAGSTALTERLGDAAFRAKARDLDASLRTVIREHSGTAIEGKLLGDGVLAVFTSARQAIEAALACAGSGEEAGLPLHLGLHAGDVIREENNVYGGAVNIASRISGLSAPGEVLVSDIVRGLARTSAGVRFEDRGEQELKGVGEAVRVWAVVESGGE